MTQVHANPEHMRRFAQQLKQFNSQLRDMTISLRVGYSSLGDTWRDQEHHKFSEEFIRTMRELDHFMNVSEAQISSLQRKAAILEEFPK